MGEHDFDGGLLGLAIGDSSSFQHGSVGYGKGVVDFGNMQIQSSSNVAAATAPTTTPTTVFSGREAAAVATATVTAAATAADAVADLSMLLMAREVGVGGVEVVAGFGGGEEGVGQGDHVVPASSRSNAPDIGRWPTIDATYNHGPCAICGGAGGEFLCLCCCSADGFGAVAVNRHNSIAAVATSQPTPTPTFFASDYGSAEEEEEEEHEVEMRKGAVGSSWRNSPSPALVPDSLLGADADVAFLDDADFHGVAEDVLISSLDNLYAMVGQSKPPTASTDTTLLASPVAASLFAPYSASAPSPLLQLPSLMSLDVHEQAPVQLPSVQPFVQGSACRCGGGMFCTCVDMTSWC